MNNDDLRFENMTEEDLKATAEIFIYMNTCPLKDWFAPWLAFYNNLFRTKSPYHIILTLNRLMKSSDINFRTINEKLFKRAATLLSLKFHEIKRVLPGMPKTQRNTSFDHALMKKLKTEGGSVQCLFESGKI